MAVAVDGVVAAAVEAVGATTMVMVVERARGSVTRATSNVSSVMAMDTMPTGVQEQEKRRRKKKHTMSRRLNMSL
jgi:hypothetical protein